ncbi:carbohydrate ABC transporter permease [bacterium]|nr:MAG: carbohydrate ABC transporter permease [bacterium]
MTRHRINRVFWHLVLLLFALFMLAPVLWMVSTSFKPEGETVSETIHWIPQTFTTDSYEKLFESGKKFPVTRWFANSVFISLTGTLLVLAVTSMAAYALSRLHFKGREGIFRLVLSTLMIPAPVVLIPVFVIVTRLGLFDSYPALILPGGASAFGVFLLRQFFLGIPAELEEAAFLDGAGHWRVFWQVMLPLCKPALGTLAIFTFIGFWNDFAWPLIVTNDLSMRTIPVGLAIFQGQYVTQYSITMAAAVLASLPMLVAFLIFQKNITEGIAMTGLK